jgi:6-phosphofructokinase 1
VVVAEGCRHHAASLVDRLMQDPKAIGFELRATTLGHVQRGGAPSAADRLLASRLGAAAIEALAQDEHNVLVGFIGDKHLRTPLAEVIQRQKPLNPELLALAPILER